MNRLSLLLIAFTTIAYIPFIHPVCTLGNLQPVSGVAPDTGDAPYSLVYSPFLNGKLFAAVGNADSDNVSVYQVNTTTGVFTEIVGSPFDTDGTSSYFVAYSPIVAGNVFAAIPNYSSDTITIYSVNPTTGALTQVPTSPFPAGAGPYPLAFSPLLPGGLFAAVANYNDETISVYSVDPTTGAFTLVPGPTVNTGSAPYFLAYSPLVNGNLFAAVANLDDDTVSVYKVDTTTGAFIQVGAPVPTGESEPYGVVFSPVISGNLFAAVTNVDSSAITIYKVDTTTGVFTEIVASPISPGLDSSPYYAAYSPVVAGNLFAAAANYDSGVGTLSVYTVDPITGAFTQVPLSPFPAGVGPFPLAFTPLLPGGLFLATVDYSAETVLSYKVLILVATITAPSSVIHGGSSVTINATITGGVPPYTVVWSDGLTQTTSTSSVTRVVTPYVTTQYQIASVTDSNGCVAAASNQITITVIPIISGCGC